MDFTDTNVPKVVDNAKASVTKWQASVKTVVWKVMRDVFVQLKVTINYVLTVTWQTTSTSVC